MSFSVKCGAGGQIWLMALKIMMAKGFQFCLESC